MKTIYTLLLLFSFSQSFSQIYKLGIITGRDSCDFSSNCSITTVDTAASNSWTLSNFTGTKVLLANGYNDSYALVTDTARYYKSNSSSSFTVYKNTGEESNYTDGNFLLSFYHKLNSDSAKDGGFIEVSFDDRQTWENVIYDSVNIECSQSTFGLNMYTGTQLLANGQPGFSGDINEWTLVEVPFTMYILTKKPRAVHIRFTFVSDSIPDTKEGWAIDNIKLSQVQLPGGLNKQSSVSHIFRTSPNPCMDELQITASSDKLNGTISIYSIEGKLVARYTLDNIQTQQFDTRALPTGMYSLIYRDMSGASYFQKFIKTE